MKHLLVLLVLAEVFGNGVLGLSMGSHFGERNELKGVRLPNSDLHHHSQGSELLIRRSTPANHRESTGRSTYYEPDDNHLSQNLQLERESVIRKIEESIAEHKADRNSAAVRMLCGKDLLVLCILCWLFVLL